jgi:hypothetical protein
MSLPGCQQRALDAIEGILQARDPRLAKMFAIFTRLAGQDPMPRREQLVRRGQAAAARVGRRLRWAGTPRTRLGAAMLLPVLVVVIACFGLLGPLSGARPGCGGAPQARTSAALAARWDAICGIRADNGTARVVFQH